MSDRPPFPEIVDSTIIGSFRSCRRKFELEYLNHWKPKVPSVHLHAGGAYAKGLETVREAYYVHGDDADTAVAKGLGALLEFYGDFECPMDSAKSAARMAGALEYYFHVWPLDSDPAVPATLPSGGKAIEFSFAEPTDVIHPVTGNPILYTGRMDMMVEYAGGLFGEDDKTTSSLGPSWSKQWDLRSQFTGYCWAAGRAGMKLNGFLVRGISILKTKYDNAEAITYRPQWMIDRWYTQLCRDIEDMKRCWEQGYWDYNLDSSCLEYGGCGFRQICITKDPQPWLETNFERRIWNPIAREEQVVK